MTCLQNQVNAISLSAVALTLVTPKRRCQPNLHKDFELKKKQQKFIHFAFYLHLHHYYDYEESKALIHLLCSCTASYKMSKTVWAWELTLALG